MNAVSRVFAERVVRCPISVAHEYVEDFFRDISARGAEIRVRMRDLVPSVGGRIKQPVRIELDRRADEAEAGRAQDAFEVCWTAGTRFFPDFRGTLRLRIASVEQTRLTLEGEYHPPLGPAGAVFDALLGRRIARASMTDLLRRLAHAMERQERAFRGEPPPA